MSHLDQEKQEQKSMMIALVLVIGVLMGFNWFFPSRSEKVEAYVSMLEPVSANSESRVAIEQKAQQVTPQNQELKNVTVPLKNDFVSGSLSAAGTQFDSLSLLQYRETTAENSPYVSLLNKGFLTQLNWTSSDAHFPNTSMAPQVSGNELTPFTPIVLTWTNGLVTVERTVALDDAYLFRVTDKITNHGTEPVQATLNGQIIRKKDTIPTKATSVHEGFLGFFDNREVEEKYTDIEDDEPFSTVNKGGWIGITDKYWQAVFVPDQSMTSDMSFLKKGEDYIASFVSKPETIRPGETLIKTTSLFAGAKELQLLNQYTDAGIPRFDLSIDFGWYYFLTKPFLYFLGFLYSLVGNMGVAILIFATLLRIALLPIATKSYESMAKMKKIQPKIKALQEKFKDNKQQLQLEMMNLYKRDKVNPASGCLPLLIQIPVFFALYKVLSVSILMRQAPFFGWITDLSVPDPSSVFTAFGYLPWPIPSVLNIGVWPVLMGLTMVIQQRLNPSPSTDENQKIIMNMMPVIFTFMLGNFAAGLVIYWTWSNILSIAQQKYIMKKVGV